MTPEDASSNEGPEWKRRVEPSIQFLWILFYHLRLDNSFNGYYIVFCMDFPLLSLQTPRETAMTLAERSKSLRLLKAWTRETLALRAGVSTASLKRFETTGAASLDLVLRIAFTLGRMEDFTPVFKLPEAATLKELEARYDHPARKRGRL